jgi:hypothetical protein
VVNVVVIRGHALRLIDERAALGERVVHIPDELRIAQSLASKLRREARCELLELAQLVANVNLVILVQHATEERLGTASVLDRLRGEEEVLGGGMVKGTILGCGGRRGAIGRVFEEKYDAVDGRQGGEGIGIEGYEFFELYVLDAEVVEQESKDSSVRFDCNVSASCSYAKQPWPTCVPASRHVGERGQRARPEMS